MNNQEIFDTVSKHLLTQNKKSMGTKGCAYRGEDGCMCAVGALIRDEFYSEILEGNSVQVKIVINALELSGLELTEATGYLLNRLQLLHDTNEPEDWKVGLKNIADIFNLEFRA